MNSKSYYTYLLECADKTLYCGYTDDVEKRVKTHNSGKGAKYTKSRLPVKCVYFEEFDTKSEATKREFEIKSLTRREKLELIKDFEFEERTEQNGQEKFIYE